MKAPVILIHDDCEHPMLDEVSRGRTIIQGNAELIAKANRHDRMYANRIPEMKEEMKLTQTETR